MKLERLTLIASLVLVLILTPGAAAQNDSEQLSNFAVVWHWKAKNRELVDQNVTAQFEQVKELVSRGSVENVYYNSNPEPADRFLNYPNISFVIRANSYSEGKV